MHRFQIVSWWWQVYVCPVVGSRRVNINEHFDNENTFLAWFSMAGTMSMLGVSLIPWEAPPGGKLSVDKERKAWTAAAVTCQALAAAILMEGARRFFIRQRELVCGKVSTMALSMWAVAGATLAMLVVALAVALVDPE
jgi:type IV secretory pathway TrbD component